MCSSSFVYSRWLRLKIWDIQSAKWNVRDPSAQKCRVKPKFINKSWICMPRSRSWLRLRRWSGLHSRRYYWVSCLIYFPKLRPLGQKLINTRSAFTGATKSSIPNKIMVSVSDEGYSISSRSVVNSSLAVQSKALGTRQISGKFNALRLPIIGCFGQ